MRKTTKLAFTLLFQLFLLHGVFAQKDVCGKSIATIDFSSKAANPTKPTVLKAANPTKPTIIDNLSPAQQSLILKAAATIKANPECRILIKSYGAFSKVEQQASWDKTNATIRYFVERTGISDKRFIFSYGEQGNNNYVDISFSSDEGPQTLPPPHPNLRN